MQFLKLTSVIEYFLPAGRREQTANQFPKIDDGLRSQMFVGTSKGDFVGNSPARVEMSLDK